MSQRQLVIYEADPAAPGGGRMYGLDPNQATGIGIPAFTSGPVTPTVGTTTGQAFLNTTSGQAVVWDGARWNPIIPATITTYPTDAAILGDTAATPGTYAFATSTGNFFVRFNQAGTNKWRQIGIAHYATQAGMLADSPADGTFAYALDVDLFFAYKNGQWHPESELLAPEATLLGLAPGVAGQRGIATDTGRNFTWTGTAWAGDPFRTYATQAALLADLTPPLGVIATAQDTSLVFMKGQVGWQGVNVAGSAPVGEIIMFPSLTPPANFLLCDGSTFNATAFPQLNTVLGGNRLPDLRGKFIRGASATRAPLSSEAQATARPTNNFTGDAASAGSHTHVLWQRRMAHYSGHGYSSVSQTASEGINAGGAVTVDGRHMNADGAHTHSVTINGGGDAETRPANIALAYHIRAAL
jgi:hypothetical protein